MNEIIKEWSEIVLPWLLVDGVKIVITAVGAWVLYKGFEIGPILAGAGIVGLALGFGGQYLIRDIITGLFIILENQYRIGDVVNFDSTGGLVEDISLRKW